MRFAPGLSPHRSQLWSRLVGRGGWSKTVGRAGWRSGWLEAAASRAGQLRQVEGAQAGDLGHPTLRQPVRGDRGRDALGVRDGAPPLGVLVDVARADLGALVVEAALALVPL